MVDRKKKGQKSKFINGLIDSEWNQDPPYNDQCPLYGNVRSLVGCTALAMSQLMRYYEWPVSGIGDFSSYTYNWQNMPSSIISSNSDVSQICYHTGLSVNAQYTDTNTTAFISDTPIALSKDFNYTSQLRSQAKWYTYSDWIDSLKSEIYDRPLLYGGYFPFDTTIVDSNSMHTWIIDNYQNTGIEEFNFNVGQIDTNLNKWYIASEIISLDEWKDNNAIFYIKPDHPDSALTMPYTEDFENVITENGAKQIPPNTGVSHTIASDGYMTMYVTESKRLQVGNSGDSTQWFVLKKIDLTSASDKTPVVKFKIKIEDTSGLAGGDALIVEVSNNNRITWNQVYNLNITNYNADDFDDLDLFKDEIINLNKYRDQPVNIRFRFEYSGSLIFCQIDDIEVVEGIYAYAKIAEPVESVWDYESYEPSGEGFPILGDIVDVHGESVDRSGIIEDFKLDTLSMYEFTPDIPINFKYTWPTDSGALPWNNAPLKGGTKTDGIVTAYEPIKRIDTASSKEVEYPVEWGTEHFDLKNPGVYNLIAIGEDADPLDDEYIAVIPDTTQIIIPPWKLKLRGDFLYYDGTYVDGGFIPYIEKKEYSKNQQMKMYIWRPFLDLPIFENSITITHNGSIVASGTENPSTLETYTANKIVGTNTPLTDTFGLSLPIEWNKSDDQDPGFYQIRASGYDSSLGVEIVQEKEIQIPPMYYDFENLWPDDWDKDASTANPTLWKLTRIHDAVWSHPLEHYYIYGYYDTYNHISISLETPEITLNKDYDAYISAWVSLPRVNSEWAPLVAEYTVEASINGGGYLPVYEPVQEHYAAFDNAVGTMNCMRPFFYSLGKSASTVQLRFNIIGDPGKYSSETIEQMFCIDDIKIMYTKDEIPVSPIIESASQNEKSNQIVWKRDDSKGGLRTLDIYNVYKNGMKIDTTVETTYIDTVVESYTTYNYGITRQIDDHPILKETSIFDCNITLITTELTFPRPVSFELIQGTGIEESNATLSWNAPKAGVIEYMIYRNGEYVNSTTDITYTDCFLPVGDYSYYVIAKYTTPIGESWATDTKSVTVNGSTSDSTLPIIESFENNGLLPDGWTIDDRIGHTYIVDSTTCNIDINDEDYMLMLETEPDPEPLNFNIHSSIITSSGYNLLNCSETEVSFNIFQNLTNVFTSNIELHVGNMVELIEFSSLEKNVWDTLSFAIDDQFLTNDLTVSLETEIYPYNQTSMDSIFIDNIMITAKEANPPSNIVITRNATSTSISWDAVPNAINYYIYRSKKPDIDYIEVGTSTVSTFTDNSLLDDGVYFYKIVTEIEVPVKQGGIK